MPRRLAGAGILALIVLLGISMPAITAHAEVPVLNGKVLLYWGSGEWLAGGYTSIIYMYNDTSIAIVSASYNSGIEYAETYVTGPYIISYDPSANKLVFHGTLMYAFDSALDCNEPSDRDQMLFYLLMGFEGYILPKFFIENLNQIASTGYVNVVQTYVSSDNAEHRWVTETCTAPFNSTLLSISTGTYMGYPVVIVTLNSEVLGLGRQPIKAYWRNDGVLLALVNGTQPLVKLVAEDDLGPKKSGEAQQPSSGAGSTQGTTSSTTTSEQEGAETSTQTPAGGSGVAQSGQPSPASSTSTAGQQSPQPATPGSASSITTATPGLSTNTLAVAVAVAAVLVAVAVLAIRKK